MGVYVLTDGKGSYICVNNNKYVPIRELRSAEKFDSEYMATMILNNQVAKKIRDEYSVQYVDSQSGETLEQGKEIDTQKQLVFRNIDNDNIDCWLERITSIQNVINGSTERSDELSEKLSEIDKEIVDIEHYIEFGNFNCYQGWMCFKMLQNMLRQRRKYKNEMEVLNLINKCSINPTAMNTLAESIKNIKNKGYRPRAFPELFRQRSYHNE